VRVSSTWFAFGVDMLWREPLGSALDGAAPPVRRAFYADMIVACGRIPAVVLADGLPLRRLRRLGMHGQWLDDEAAADPDVARILPYLRPTLEQLRCDLRPALLAHLAALPQHGLRSLHVNLCSGGGEVPARFAALVDWLPQQPLLALESLHADGLPFGTDAAATERAMDVFARLPALQQLDLQRRNPFVRQIMGLAMVTHLFVRATQALYYHY
jgi:hypothetical protein